MIQCIFSSSFQDQFKDPFKHLTPCSRHCQKHIMSIHGVILILSQLFRYQLPAGPRNSNSPESDGPRGPFLQLIPQDLINWHRELLSLSEVSCAPGSPMWSMPGKHSRRMVSLCILWHWPLRQLRGCWYTRWHARFHRFQIYGLSDEVPLFKPLLTATFHRWLDWHAAVQVCNSLCMYFVLLITNQQKFCELGQPERQSACYPLPRLSLTTAQHMLVQCPTCICLYYRYYCICGIIYVGYPFLKPNRGWMSCQRQGTVNNLPRRRRS